MERGIRRFWSGAWVLAGVALLLAAAGCGGSPSGDGSRGGAGRVAVFLTDGAGTGAAKAAAQPSEDALGYREVLVTITRVELLGEGGAAVTLYDGPPRRVDLLDLRSASLLLCLLEVPVGTYEKLRLTTSQIELVDAEGLVEVVEPLANGKIDLNPQGPFTVGPDETVVVQLDTKHALHVVETGGGKVQFRPEVFVSVRSVPRPWPEGRLVRLQGSVVALSADLGGDPAKERWVLLSPWSGGLPTGGDDGLAPCLIKVGLGAEASFFDDQALEIAFADLALGDFVTVVGGFPESVLQDDGGGLPPTFEFAGALVERGTFVRLAGTVLTSPTSAPGTFLFRLDPGQGLRGDLVVDVHVFAGTKIYGPEGEPATLGDLAVWPDLPPVRARLDAVLDLSDARPDVAHAAMIAVEGRPSPGVRAAGTVVSFDQATGALTLRLPAAAEGGASQEATFVLGEGTHFYRFAAGSTLDPAEPAEVAPGAVVLVFGRRDEAGQVLVDDVFLRSSPPA